jgi:hypothetical protein
MTNLEKLIQIQSILKLSSQTTPILSEYLEVLIVIEKEYI